jgi:hypothetical protein
MIQDFEASCVYNQISVVQIDKVSAAGMRYMFINQVMFGSSQFLRNWF